MTTRTPGSRASNPIHEPDQSAERCRNTVASNAMTAAGKYRPRWRTSGCSVCLSKNRNGITRVAKVAMAATAMNAARYSDSPMVALLAQCLPATLPVFQQEHNGDQGDGAN